MSKLTSMMEMLEAQGLDYSISLTRTITEGGIARPGMFEVMVDRPPPDDRTGMLVNARGPAEDQDNVVDRALAILAADNIPPKMKCAHAVPGSDSCNLNNLQCSAPACKTVPA